MEVNSKKYEEQIIIDHDINKARLLIGPRQPSIIM